jgi:hypothetical protein
MKTKWNETNESETKSTKTNEIDWYEENGRIMEGKKYKTKRNKEIKKNDISIF